MTLDEEENLAYEMIKKLEWEDLTMPIRGVEKVAPIIKQALKNAATKERARIVGLLRQQKPYAMGYEWEEGGERWAELIEKSNAKDD